MSRRSKLVYLWSLNAIMASAVVVLGMLLFEKDNSAYLAGLCGGADEPKTADRFITTSDTFYSIGEAERFICHDVAYPRQPRGWLVENISATRSAPAAFIGRGIGFASVTLDYMQLNNEAADLRLEVSPFEIDPVTYGIIDHIPIMDSQATLIQGLNASHYILQWQADGFSFYVEANLADDFGLTELYDILNSIR